MCSVLVRFSSSTARPGTVSYFVLDRWNTPCARTGRQSDRSYLEMRPGLPTRESSALEQLVQNLSKRLRPRSPRLRNARMRSGLSSKSPQFRSVLSITPPNLCRKQEVSDIQDIRGERSESAVTAIHWAPTTGEGPHHAQRDQGGFETAGPSEHHRTLGRP